MAHKLIDDILLVDEEMIKEAILFLMTKEKVIAEAAGAIGVGVIMNKPKLFENKNTAIVISGGNLDDKLMLELIKKI